METQITYLWLTKFLFSKLKYQEHNEINGKERRKGKNDWKKQFSSFRSVFLQSFRSFEPKSPSFLVEVGPRSTGNRSSAFFL